MIKKKSVVLLLISFISFLFYCSESSNPIESDESNSFILNAPDRITNSSISLNWTKYPDSNFAEYRLNKIYKDFEDIQNDEIIGISTNINDSTFTDHALFSNKNYSYTIEVVTKTNNKVTSNTINVKTKESALDFDYENTYDVNEIKYFKNFGKEIKGISFQNSSYWVLLFEEKGGYYDVILSK